MTKYCLLWANKTNTRVWISTESATSKRARVFTEITAVDAEELPWRELTDGPKTPGPGVFYYDVTTGAMHRAPMVSLDWSTVLTELQSES